MLLAVILDLIAVLISFAKFVNEETDRRIKNIRSFLLTIKTQAGKALIEIAQIKVQEGKARIEKLIYPYPPLLNAEALRERERAEEILQEICSDNPT